MLRTCVWLVVASLVAPAAAAAQGLADVARAEAARRRTAPHAVKVYTNRDLRPDPRPPVGPSDRAEPGDAAPSTAAPADTPLVAASPAAADAAGPLRDEAYWRARITAAREDLRRSRLFADAIQSRINALTTDFVNRDDPAQRALIADDRQAALAEASRLETEIQDLTQAIADIEEEARRAGVPPGWLR